MLLKKKTMGQQENLQYLETNDNANRTIQNLWAAWKAVLEIHSDSGPFQEVRKCSNTQPNILPKRIRKRKKQSQQKEGNNKDQRENKVEI